MIKIGDQFIYHGTWYKVVEVKGEMVTTIEDPDLNKHPNVRDYIFWDSSQIEQLIEQD